MSSNEKNSPATSCHSSFKKKKIITKSDDGDIFTSNENLMSSPKKIQQEDYDLSQPQILDSPIPVEMKQVDNSKSDLLDRIRGPPPNEEAYEQNIMLKQ